MFSLIGDVCPGREARRKVRCDIFAAEIQAEKNPPNPLDTVF
jgi:hypothetical protein